MKEIYEELFIDSPKMGPGSKESIRKAYSYLENLPNRPRILDIGCGSGLQTIELAKLSRGKVYGIDIYQAYLNKLLKKAKKERLTEQIKVFKKSMMEMDFETEFFDLVWADSSIFVIGFKKGLKEWKKFLKKNGYMVVSELIWFKESRPPEVEEFWEKEYPDIKTNQENLQIIKNLGYTLIGQFKLPEEDWWANLYTPLEKKVIDLKKKYKDDTGIMEFLELQQKEINLYRKYSKFYGYCYYIMQE
jgi:ubiquinone/menaquinone biosynthesis C-methylase UbiE